MLKKLLLSLLSLIIINICIALLSAMTYGQQIADPNFDPKVARPAYLKIHPKVLFDEAHNNFHTATGRYKPFADLIANDGYLVTSNKKKFQKKLLDGYDVLIIANALGKEEKEDSAAFTEKECDVVRDWVRRGGALLFIADHTPFGAAAENLAKRFNVEMSKGYTMDSANFDLETGNNSFLVFSRDNNLLANHPITQGLNASERINRVMTFTGQSLKITPGGTMFLKLSDTAIDITEDQLEVKPSLRRKTSAAGRAQGAAIKFGKGRVVVLGEAAMLSAQLAEGTSFGMNVKGIDNRQLGLNIMHWLSRLLK